MTPAIVAIGVAAGIYAVSLGYAVIEAGVNALVGKDD